jgi:putative MATE family efflux protein
VSEPLEAGEPPRAPTGGGRRWRDRDHTRGHLLVSLLVLALPQFAGSLANVGFQLVDLAFISRLGEAPMAAVIIVNQSLRQLLVMLVMGLSFGSQALIARSVGAGRVDEAEHVAGQLVTLGIMLALVVATLGLAAPELLFSLPGPDPSFFPYGVPYARLVFALNFGLMGSMFFSAILAGAGDTTTPLFVMLIQAGVAIAAEWLLIFGNLGAPELGVQGVALGVAAGQITAMSIGLTLLFRGRARVHLRRHHLVPDLSTLRRILALSWPPAVQMMGSVAMIFAFLRLTGQFGENVQAAYAIGLRLGMIAPMLCFPLANGCAVLVGQALGSGNPARAWRAIGVGLLVHGSLMLSFALVLLLFPLEILLLFTDDPAVLEVGVEYLRFTAGSFAAWAFFFVFFRALQGAGDMLVPMAISLASAFLISLPLGYGLAVGLGIGPTGIWIALLTQSVVSTTGTGLWLATGRWARRRAH